jgi:hypothetical protein
MSVALSIAVEQGAATEHDVTQVKLRETPDGHWILAFRFPEPQKAVVFRQAPEPYRGGRWTSLTEGVAVETVGQTDIMLFEHPATDAMFEIEPRTTSLSKAYTPFLAFTDGGWGVLEGQFRVSSATDRAEVESFDGDGESWPGELLDYSLTIESPRRIFDSGDGGVQSGENYVGFVDSGLPAWIRDQLDGDLAAIFAELSTEWGLTLPEPVEVLFVFDGSEQPGLHQTGGAIGRQLALQVSGDALLEPDASILDYFRWFLAHESAHAYQNAAGMRGVPPAHAWMQEGAANTMSHRIGGRLSENREKFLEQVYGRAFADCTAYLDTGEPLAAAFKSGRFDAYYACGDLIALVTEAGLDGGDIFDLWRAFLAKSNAAGAPEIAPELFFSVARERGLADDTAKQLEALVFEPVSDPSGTLRELLEQSGLEPRFDQKGKLQSLAVPR